ncbi:MAG: CrcB family protein [Mycolicibacterium neoaurum]|uniref:fluoride efflux transporter FluC n=1 Tax=Mycolicibacterium neoaurum TaxID=1795 RepID=UPI002FF6F40B
MADHHDPITASSVDPDAVEPAPSPLHVRPSAIAAVALGGLLGAPARYGLEVAFPQVAGQWPVTTFAINVMGAFLLGVLLEGLSRLGPDTGWRQRLRLGVGTGVLGSFTTYSTLAVDTDELLRRSEWWAAGSYAVGTVLVGGLATVIGIAVGTRIPRRGEEADR